jgi:single-strand DNA-binding protein
MSKDLNKVMITGRLGADPEMRFTPQGTPVTTFRVASGRSWKSAGGTTQEATEWFRVVAWNKLAEVCNEYLSKGSRVYIEGRLQTRSWTGDDGQERFSTEVVASDLIMLDSRKTPDTAAAVEAAEEAEAIAPSHPAAPAQASRQRTPPPQRKAPPRRAARQTAASAFDEADLPF